MSHTPIIVSAHQPNYLPWLGYFHKMTYSDVFVFLDDVQYTPKTYINRCFVRQSEQKARLSIPVSVPAWNATICEAMINTEAFSEKHLETFRHAYGKCRAFGTVMDALQPAYQCGEVSLASFNIRLITALADFIGLSPKFVRQSELGITSSSNRLLIDLTHAVGGDIFVSGVGAKNYITGHEIEYRDDGVELAYQNFIHPVYRQQKQPFIQGCSVIDLAFNHASKAHDILTSQSSRPYMMANLSS